ncbi:dihydrolipoamide acetyltransferase family protein [Streptomyces sp. NPDC016845]|uniref:dihydrolipoamide acetyltransferase family protein n=1 Tax=Streptomyces sp. NPDC016845 TaxID=3364972 RepID=UPI0037B200D6
MAQVLEFKLPDLGEGLTEAEIVRWLVSVGDVVAVDQPVVEVETAKAMVEVPCPYGGVVTARFGEEGVEMPVGAPLLTVAVGEPDPAEDGGSAGSGSEGSGNVLVGYGTAAPAARRRRVRPTGAGGTGFSGADESGGEFHGDAPRGQAAASAGGLARTPAAPLSPGSSRGTEAGRAGAGSSARGAGVSVSEAPITTSSPGTAAVLGSVPVISPIVRKLARDRGLDLREVRGTGPEGLILRGDVERALAALVVEPAAQAARAPAPEGHRTPLRGVRGAVADKLSRSRREIPDATCWVDADATELMHARETMNAATGPSAGPKISVLALLARICTAALARHPELNATVDMERREIVRLDEVHLGFAAQAPRGLVVPVVRDAHARGAESLSAEFARLTEAARAGTLTPGELTGGTFTLNNYGVFGVDGSTPIINHPEAAMLGVGRITPKPWVHQGGLAVRQVVQLSLTFDHRVCDGGTAGGFLRYVADCVEQPAVLLRSL